MTSSLDDVTRFYDVGASDYLAKFIEELSHKPLDRILLDRFAELVSDVGRCVTLAADRDTY